MKDPVVIIEVLSDSTEVKFTEKVDLYQSLPTLRAYIIIDQYSCWIRMYERDSNDIWRNRLLNDMEDTLAVNGFDWEIPLTAIYQDVKFKRKEVD